jgi:hypothetical protein
MNALQEWDTQPRARWAFNGWAKNTPCKGGCYLPSDLVSVSVLRFSLLIGPKAHRPPLSQRSDHADEFAA